jgi:hypothetical protein
MRPKHKNDYNHGKRGWVSGNPRYQRNRRNQSRIGGAAHKDRTMKGLGRS